MTLASKKVSEQVTYCSAYIWQKENVCVTAAFAVTTLAAIFGLLASQGILTGQSIGGTALKHASISIIATSGTMTLVMGLLSYERPTAYPWSFQEKVRLLGASEYLISNKQYFYINYDLDNIREALYYANSIDNNSWPKELDTPVTEKELDRRVEASIVFDNKKILIKRQKHYQLAAILCTLIALASIGGLLAQQGIFTGKPIESTLLKVSASVGLSLGVLSAILAENLSRKEGINIPITQLLKTNELFLIHKDVLVLRTNNKNLFLSIKSKEKLLSVLDHLNSQKDTLLYTEKTLQDLIGEGLVIKRLAFDGQVIEPN